jgi:hypothetical protein
MKNLFALLFAAAACAQVSPTTITVTARQAVNTGGAVDAWQSYVGRGVAVQITASGPWTATDAGAVDLTITPASGTGNATVFVVPEYKTTPGTYTATITVTGAAAPNTVAYTLDARSKLPLPNSAMPAGTPCTNPVETLYGNPASCLGTWTSTGNGNFVDDSTGAVITRIATGHSISYTSMRPTCKHPTEGELVIARETTGAQRTRVLRLSDGTVVRDSLPQTHEHTNWSREGNCDLIYSVTTGQIYRLTVSSGSPVVIADYSSQYNVDAGTGVAWAIFTGGTYSTNDGNFLSFSAHLPGRASLNEVCVVHLTGLSTANQASKTKCVDMLTIPNLPAPTYIKNTSITERGQDGRMFLAIGDTNGIVFCPFDGSSAILPAACWRLEALGQGGANNQDGLCAIGEGCQLPAHTDFVRDPSSGEILMYSTMDEYRQFTTLARLSAREWMLRPLEEGGGLHFVTSMRADGASQRAGSEWGCARRYCWRTAYSGAADTFNQQAPNNMGFDVFDLWDRVWHRVLSGPLAVGLDSLSQYDYNRVPQGGLTEDGCTGFISTGLTSAAAADRHLYRFTTGALCSAQPSALARRGLSARAGSTRAVISYDAPTAAACTVGVSTTPAVIFAYHADTSTPAADNRAGSVSVGRSRQFVAGTVAALTPSTQYHARIKCGSEWSHYLSFRTRPAGDGGAVFSFPTARTGEISTSPDMSTPTAIPSAVSHTVAVPSGQIRYYRSAGGSIQVVL